MFKIQRASENELTEKDTPYKERTQMQNTPSPCAITALPTPTADWNDPRMWSKHGLLTPVSILKAPSQFAGRVRFLCDCGEHLVRQPEEVFSGEVTDCGCHTVNGQMLWDQVRELEYELQPLLDRQEDLSKRNGSDENLNGEIESLKAQIDGVKEEIKAQMIEELSKPEESALSKKLPRYREIQETLVARAATGWHVTGYEAHLYGVTPDLIATYQARQIATAAQVVGMGAVR